MLDIHVELLEGILVEQQLQPLLAERILGVGRRISAVGARSRREEANVSEAEWDGKLLSEPADVFINYRLRFKRPALRVIPA